MGRETQYPSFSLLGKSSHPSIIQIKNCRPAFGKRANEFTFFFRDMVSNALCALARIFDALGYQGIEILTVYGKGVQEYRNGWFDDGEEILHVFGGMGTVDPHFNHVKVVGFPICQEF